MYCAKHAFSFSLVFKEDSDDTTESSSSEEEDTGPSTRTRKEIPQSRVWRKKDLHRRNNGWVDQQPDFLQQDLTPTKCFERCFDDFVIGHMITKRLRYANNKGDQSFTVEEVEMRAFLAILFISGYNDLPRRRMYWEKQDDVNNLAVSNTMRRTKFKTTCDICIYLITKSWIKMTICQSEAPV